MAKGAYIGVLNKAHKAKKGYIGVGGKARKVKKAYIGVNGKARLWWSGLDGKFWGIVAGESYYGNFISINNVDNTVLETQINTGARIFTTFCANKYITGYTSDTIDYSVDGITYTSLSHTNRTVGKVLGFASDNNYVYVLFTTSTTDSYLESTVYLSIVNMNTLSVSELHPSTSNTKRTGRGDDTNGLSILPSGEIVMTPFSSDTVWIFNLSTWSVTSQGGKIWGGAICKRGISADKVGAFDDANCIGYWTKSAFTKQSTYKTFSSYIVYGNGKFVAVDIHGSKDKIIWSNDLINWNETTMIAKTRGVSSFSRLGLGYGDGKFILFDNKSPYNIYVSSDAITWTNIGTCSKTLRSEVSYDTTYGFGDK